MKKIGWNKSQILILIYEISGSFDTAVDNNLESLFNIVLIVEFSPVFFPQNIEEVYMGCCTRNWGELRFRSVTGTGN